MIKSRSLHWFVAGIFTAAVFSQASLVAISILAILLITRWGNYILPICAALLIDTSFVDVRNFSNLFGFMFTVITTSITLLLLPLRKFLKL